MNTTLRPGVRKLPSLLNLQILNLLRSGESDPTLAQLTAPLTSDPLIGINNGTFDTPENWSTRGAANIIQGQAVLTEESRLNSSFTQNFIIPEEAKYLQFTILESDLDTSNLAPGDAFEVALLNNQNLSLAGTAAGLTHTDALLNIQHDGDAYFSNKVNISGTTSSGNQIDLNVTRTVTIDISHINANTEATLYFDLLGFGDKESRVVIDNVRILTDDILIPTANNDTATTNQGKPVTINVLDNDTDADGTINPSTIQIESAPVNGNITINDDGTITYTPSGNATVDTFTYTVKDNDNNTSNTATVNITINNSAPSIREIIVEPNLSEGIAATFSANAIDEEEITYSWNFGDNTPTLNGQSVTHTFLDNGTYTATLTVTDSNGASTVETLTLNVNNIAPTVTAGEDQTTIDFQAITFNGNYTDPGILDTHTIRWEFGDGTVVENELNPNYTYTNPGTYTATLSVTDKDGGSSSDTLQIQVNNAAPTITEITGDTNLEEGAIANFNATATSHGDDTLTYTWDFGDGSTTVEGETVNHQFADNGTYTVTLTVTNQGGSTQQTLTVNVDNVSPVVEALDNQITLQGTTVNFDGSFTDPGILDTHTIEWDFGDSFVATGILEPTHTYATPGTYNVTLTITDSDGAATQDILTVTVNNAAPTITELTGDTNINEGDTATFSANATDAGNDNLTYTWNFGDGAESQVGKIVNHKFVDNGTYTVTVTVEDTNGASTQQTLTVQVDNVAPTITEITGDTVINEGDTANYTATVTDPGDDKLTYSWNFGDGSTPKTGENVSHIFTDDGIYTVTLTVEDGDGGIATETITVTVNNVAPTITEITGDTNINEGDIATFKAIANDPGNDKLTYTWDFGDGSTPIQGDNVSHKYLDNGDYTVTLTVTDDDGASTTQTQTLTVNNLAPIVNAGISRTIIEGESITFNGSFNDSGILDTHSIKWDFGDGTVIEGEAADYLNPTHIYANPGNYTVTLTVTDNDGASTTDTLQLNVLEITKLKFQQEKLSLRVYEDSQLVEDVRGNQNKVVKPLAFERMQIVALNSDDLPNVLDDVTFHDNGEGIGITDGEDWNSKRKKRIDGDEVLQIRINSTDKYDSAKTAYVTVDRVQGFDKTIGGKVKIIALQGATVVGEQVYELTDKKQTITFTNDTIFDRLHLMAGDDNTEFTLRAAEFDAVKTNNTAPTYLKFSQRLMTLKVEENGTVVEQIRGSQNQPVADAFERIKVTAIDSEDNVKPLIDRTFHDNGEGIGITDGEDGNTSRKKRIDRDEILQLEIQANDNYNSALSAVVKVDRIQSIANNTDGGKVKIVAYRNGVIVGSKTYTIGSETEELYFLSNQAFDKLQLQAADDDTKFTFRSAEFETVHTAQPTTASLKFVLDKHRKATVYENNVLVNQIKAKQNQALDNVFERIEITAIDSEDGKWKKIDNTRVDQGEGIGIADGDDGNSGSRKRIDGDEALQLKILANDNYSTARGAILGLDRVQTNGSNGGVVKVVAMRGDTVVDEKLFNLDTRSGEINFNSDEDFDALRLMAGDESTKFTFKYLDFQVLLDGE
ncbi:PKD domain-containing protein [Rivularia sp. UHCC 0363]|uniref:PKD domain-containing protein n=1 Tax=Rivularia sp. UHCC 0363 TaxID=3110244 RepID=UPI003A59977E